MANNDQIAVDLVAKTDQYNAALSSSASNTEAFGKRVTAATTSAEGGISSLASVAQEFAAGFLAAFSLDKLIEIGTRSVETADKIQKMSQQVGIATGALSALQSQAALSDVGFEQFGTAMERLARSATAAAGGAQQQSAAYSAMGVSVTDTAGKMRPLQDVLQDVAAKMAGYKDSAAKTALAQELFGRAGAKLIPLLNELGTEGFDAVRKHAEEYNQVIGPEQARASEELHDNITRIQQGMSGFANAVLREALPALVELTGNMADSAKTNDGYASSAQGVATAIVGTVSVLKDLLSIAAQIPTELQSDAKAFGDFANQVTGSTNALQKFLNLLPQVKKDSSNGLFDFGSGYLPGVQGTRDFFSSLNTPTAGSALDDKMTKVNTAPINDFDKTLKLVVGDVTAASAGIDQMAQHIDAAGLAAQKADAPIVKVGSDAADKLSQAESQAKKFLESLDAVGSDRYTKALAQYNVQLATMDQIYAKLIASGEPLAKAQDFIAQATQRAKEGFDALVQAERNKNDVDAILSLSYAKAESDLNEQIRLLGENAQAAEADALANKLINAALGDMKDFMGPLSQAQQEEIDRLTALAHGFVQQKTSIDLANQATKDWVNIWQQAGDSLASTFASILVNGGSLFNSLKSLAKQTVEQIISYFAKLAIINPILNAIFGGSAGFSMLPTLESAGASALGGGATAGASATGGSFNLFSAGQTMWSGFQKGLDGLYASGGMGSSFLGDVTYGDFGNTFAPSGLTYGASIAGGVYAGYNEFQNAGGGAAGALGGAAYGVGTAYAGIGGAAAISGGLSAGLAAVPIVGWIAIAAMLVDMFSGGKLFGTKGKVQEGSTSLNIGPDGASFSNSVSLKGQKAFFGGAKWSTQNIAETPEQAAAAQAYFDSMTKQMKQYADQFGVKAGDLVSASFQQVFDKKGKLTGETHANIAGYNYDNLTQDQFSQAYSAANQLSVLDQFDSKLEGTIAEFRKSADTLVQIANGLTQAETYLQAGGDFLAIAGKDTLSSIVTLATGMQQSGETIDQTINRLIQAQARYDQFVGQFKPAATYVDDFEGALSNINAQMLANIKQANDLAKAAGAAGASEQDLANIHQYAAKQMAAAIQQLESSAQSLAFGLGLTSTGSLDEVNAEISRLQAKANAGSSAVNNFGNAMQTAAQKASDAMNLLLGDLSPLNDRQKLQKALEGFRSGTVSADQVLQIGRRLYASSQQYTDLFNMVMQGGGHGANQAVSAHGGHSGGLSAAESQRLSDLLKEQQQLQAGAQLQQYQTLAQQIAEIASAKGEDWKQVVSDMGIDLKAFEKGIGMNDSQLDTYIKNFQSLKDSNGDNTASIVAVLNQILTALGGTPTTPDQAPAGAPAAHSGHGSRGPSGVRDEIREGFRQVILTGPRNLRPTRIAYPG